MEELCSFFGGCVETQKNHLCVLLVDDESDFLRVAKELLEIKGSFKVETASSVDEALKKLTKSAFDVVVSDYKLGAKSGLDLLKTLKATEPNLPVIFFTGKGNEEVAVKALNFGVDGYVSKHGSTETVYTELSNLIRLVVEKKNTKLALEKSRKCYHAIIDQAVDAIFVLDSTGKLLDVNQQACKSLQYTQDELLKLNITDLFADSTKEQLTAALSNLSTGHPLVFETIQKRKDQKTLPVDLSLKKILLNGEAIIVMVAKDLSERKALQTQLRDLSYRLNGLTAGESYLCGVHERAFKAYADLTFYGVPGLCIMREDPARVIKNYGVKPEDVRLLASKCVKGIVALPDLQSVSLALSEFLRLRGDGVVLLDGLEYLISVFGFDAVFRLIQEKRFDFLESGAVLLVPVDVEAFNAKEKALLLSELKMLV
ncbi:MAG: response regulator [Candidatus Bathyarchaeota archaeon]|nr:response regulator [Candidatus Bathyarchaeota archaeon]